MCSEAFVLFEALPIPCAYIDVNNGVLLIKDANPTFRKLFYKGEKTPVSLSEVYSFPAAHEAQTHVLFNSLFTSSKTGTATSALKVAFNIPVNGEMQTFWYDVKNTPVISENGSSSYIIHCLYKSSEQPPLSIPEETAIPEKRKLFDYKYVESLLMETEERHKQLFNINPVPLWIYSDVTFRFLFVNAAACEFYGYSFEEFMGMTLIDLKPEADRINWKTEYEQAVPDEHNVYNFLFRHKKKNGQIINVKIKNLKILFDGKAARLGLGIDISKEIETQRSLSETNNRLISAQQLANMGYWTLNFDSNIITWSQELYNIFEINPETFSLTFNSVIEQYHKDDKASFDIDYTQFHVGALGPFEIERRIITPDGKLKWILERIQYFPALPGSGARLEGTVLDITNRKNTVESLRKSEEKYQGLFNASPLPVWIYDPETLNFLDVNAAAVRHYGYSRAEFLNMRLTDVRPADDIPLMLAAVKSVKGKHYNDNQEIYRHTKKNGEIIFVHIESNRVWYNEKECRMALAVDVTERVRSRAELEKVNRQLKTAQEIACLGYWAKNIEDESIDISDEVYRIFELTNNSEPTNTATLCDVVHPEDKQIFRDGINSNGEEKEFEIRLINPSGKQKWIHVRLKQATGKAQKRLEGIVFDITKRKTDEQAILKKSMLLKILNEFVTGLLETNDWITVLSNNMPSIREAIGSDRIYYFDAGIDPISGNIITKRKVAWSGDPEKFRVQTNKSAPWPGTNTAEIKDKLLAGCPYECLVKDLPESDFKNSLTSKNARALFIAPVLSNGALSGILSVHDCTNDHVWDKDEKIFIKSLTSNIAEAVEKIHAKKNEEKTKTHFESVVKNIPGIVVRRIASGNMNVVYINNEITRITGYDAADFVNNVRTLESIVRPIDKDRVFDLLVHLKPGESFNTEFGIIAKDEKLIWLRGNGRAVGNKDGSPEYIDGVLLDMTESREKQKQIEMANERFRMVMKASNEAIVDWDIPNEHVYWSESFQDMFGHHLVGNHRHIWSHNIHPDDKEKILAQLRHSRDTETIISGFMEYRFMRANGTVAFVQHHVRFIRDDNGTAIRLIGSMIDVTESMERTRKIERQNLAFREIAWIQSHVVRSPLSTLMGLVYLLKNRKEFDIDFDETLNMLHDSAEKLDTVIHDIVRKSEMVEFAVSETLPT